MGLTPETTNFHVLNPYDKRGVAWKIAEGVQEPALALNLASIIVPEEPQSNAPFWASSARNLVYAAILGLNRSLGDSWTLRDLIFALDSKDRLRAVTRDHPRAQAIAGRVLEDEKHADGILSHVGTRLVQLEPLAALWHTTLLNTRFTLSTFLKEPGVVVLGGDPALQDTLRPINALLLRVMSQHIIRGPNCDTPKTWFVLDEFAAMGRVESLPDLLRLGRSKGASVLLGVQNIEGLHALYGQSGTDDILSLCTYKTFLRAGGPQTARWAESYFGQVRREETHLSHNWGARGAWGWTKSWDWRERTLFLASVFLNIPIPAPGRPFVAIHDLPCFDNSVISHWKSDFVFSMLRAPGKVGAIEPRSEIQDQTLTKWSPAEEELVVGIQQTGKKDANPGNGAASGDGTKSKTGSEASLKLPDPNDHPARRRKRKTGDSS
jgi:type IV secretory pathway TraG/TraD family ATPase VirD4